MATKYSFSLWFALAVFSGPAAASADDRVSALQNKAYDLYKAGDFEGAIKVFQEVHQLSGNAKYLFNIAAAYETMGGRCAESLKAFACFFEACKGCQSDDGEPLGPVARARHDRLRARCVSAVVIEVAPAEASILVDGVEAGRGSAKLELLEGTHRLVVTLTDRDPIEQAFSVSGGKAQTIKVAFPKPRSANTELAVQKGAPEAPAKGPDRTWMWVGFGAGAAGLAAGTIFLVSMNQSVDDEEKARFSDAPWSTVEGHRGDASTSATLAQIGYGVGVAGIATGVILLLLEPAPEATAQIRPVISPGSIGVSGAF